MHFDIIESMHLVEIHGLSFRPCAIMPAGKKRSESEMTKKELHRGHVQLGMLLQFAIGCSSNHDI